MAATLPLDNIFGLRFAWEFYRHGRRDEYLKFTHRSFAQSGAGRANPYTYEVNLGGVRTIWTADPENIKAMLGSQFEDYGRGKAFQSRWHNLLGTGIFNADGREWHNSRHRLRPLFNRQRVSNLDSFERQIQIIINRHLGGGRTVDLKDVISRFALDAIGDYAMGFQVNALADRKNDFLDALERIKTIQNIKECAGPLSWLVPTPGFKRDLKVLDDFMEPLIEHAASLPQSVLDEMEKTDHGWTYVKACASVSRDRHFLKYELMSVILAGRDTVSGTLVWTFLELVKRPDLMADLRREIENTVGIGRDAPRPTHDDLRSMRLVKNTLNETLRLYPTVSLNLRTAFRDTSLPRGNDHDGNKPVGLAEGTPVIFSSHILQLSPETYEQSPPGTSPPHVFDPYRWEEWKPKPWTYIPFGGGPRIYIGQEFALAEIAFLLVRLLQNYSRLEMRCEMRGNSDEGWERPNGSASIVKQFIMEKGRVRISGDVTLSPRDKVLMAFLP
ncbi:cytochrome P450 52A2 [Pyricularia oryzae]|nr:cytochrome P450 52A2 [Pyricularia oryzae]